MSTCVAFAISALTPVFFSIPRESDMVTFQACEVFVRDSPVSPEMKKRIFSIRTRSSEMAFL